MSYLLSKVMIHSSRDSRRDVSKQVLIVFRIWRFKKVLKILNSYLTFRSFRPLSVAIFIKEFDNHILCSRNLNSRMNHLSISIAIKDPIIFTLLFPKFSSSLQANIRYFLRLAILRVEGSREDCSCSSSSWKLIIRTWEFAKLYFFHRLSAFLHWRRREETEEDTW